MKFYSTNCESQQPYNTWHEHLKHITKHKHTENEYNVVNVFT